MMTSIFTLDGSFGWQIWLLIFLNAIVIASTMMRISVSVSSDRGLISIIALTIGQVVILVMVSVYCIVDSFNCLPNLYLEVTDGSTVIGASHCAGPDCDRTICQLFNTPGARKLYGYESWTDSAHQEIDTTVTDYQFILNSQVILILKTVLFIMCLLQLFIYSWKISRKLKTNGETETLIQA